MRFADGDDVVLPPEDFYLSDADELVPFVEIRKMQYQKVVVVVFVDFRTLVAAPAVFYIQRMKVVFL